MEIILNPIGVIRSPITDLHEGPRQGDESDVSGQLIIEEQYRDALFGLSEGSMIVILYWMHLAERDIFQVHPRGDRRRPLRGVFTTRSPQRPNPIAFGTVKVTRIQDTVIGVVGLDAVDGTPLIDIKCVATTGT